MELFEIQPGELKFTCKYKRKQFSFLHSVLIHGERPIIRRDTSETAADFDLHSVSTLTASNCFK